MVKFYLMKRKYDILWKGMLEVVVEDLLRFIQPDIDKDLDLERGFEFLDKELGEMYPEPQKPSDTRFVDKLVKVYTRDGVEKWMLLHIEVQGKNEPDFPRRMFRYYYRLLDRYDQPVAAIATLTGRDGKKIPSCYEEHCLWTREIYEYKTLCITDYTDEELMKSNNTFALVLLVAKEAFLKVEGSDKEWDEVLLEQKLLIFKLLKKRLKVGDRKYNAILLFLKNYVLFKNPETNLTFTKQIDHETQKNNTMDIFEQWTEIKQQEGLERGIKRGIETGTERATRKFVENLLKETSFSVEKIASLANVSVEFVTEVKKELR